MVPKDKDASLSTVWIVVPIAFDPYEGHGWDGTGYVAVTAEAAVFFPVNHCVDRVIVEALLILLVAQYPVVLVCFFVIGRRHEGGGTVAYEGAGGDERCVGLAR